MLTAKSFETFSKANGFGFISDSFALNGCIFVELPDKNCCLHHNSDLSKTFFLINGINGKLTSAVIVVSSDPCVKLSPRTKISFKSFSLCIDELLSSPKIIVFLPQSKFASKNSEQELYPIPYPEKKYLSESGFLGDLTV